MTKYVKVDWPESQRFIDMDLEDIFYCAGERDDEGSVFVPDNIYDEVMYKLEFPKKFENTNLGTIVCYETRAVVNGEDTYWYDEDEIKKGSEVLIYNHDIESLPKWIITKCVACSSGFPLIFEEKLLCPGINCEIIGVKIN